MHIDILLKSAYDSENSLSADRIERGSIADRQGQ
jgi:hypothetical protein